MAQAPCQRPCGLQFIAYAELMTRLFYVVSNLLHLLAGKLYVMLLTKILYSLLYLRTSLRTFFRCEKKCCCCACNGSADDSANVT